MVHHQNYLQIQILFWNCFDSSGGAALCLHNISTFHRLVTFSSSSWFCLFFYSCLFGGCSSSLSFSVFRRLFLVFLLIFVTTVFIWQNFRTFGLLWLPCCSRTVPFLFTTFAWRCFWILAMVCQKALDTLRNSRSSSLVCSSCLISLNHAAGDSGCSLGDCTWLLRILKSFLKATTYISV